MSRQPLSRHKYVINGKFTVIFVLQNGPPFPLSLSLSISLSLYLSLSLSLSLSFSLPPTPPPLLHAHDSSDNIEFDNRYGFYLSLSPLKRCQCFTKTPGQPLTTAVSFSTHKESVYSLEATPADVREVNPIFRHTGPLTPGQQNNHSSPPLKRVIQC